MITQRFNPKVEQLATVRPTATAVEIETEPMLFSCDWNTARELGGPLTQDVMSKIALRDGHHLAAVIDKGELNCLIDTKSVMLMPEFYPCIGGWHCDAVPRPDGRSQPDLSLMREDVFHYLCIIPSTPRLSNTEFIISELLIDVDENHVWRSVNAACEDPQNSDKMVLETTDGGVWKFNQPTIHRGMPSRGHGWRYFFRLTFTSTPPANKIRHQVQVYTSPDTSW